MPFSFKSLQIFTLAIIKTYLEFRLWERRKTKKEKARLTSEISIQWKVQPSRVSLKTQWECGFFSPWLSSERSKRTLYICMLVPRCRCTLGCHSPGWNMVFQAEGFTACSDFWFSARVYSILWHGWGIRGAAVLSQVRSGGRNMPREVPSYSSKEPLVKFRQVCLSIRKEIQHSTGWNHS